MASRLEWLTFWSLVLVACFLAWLGFFKLVAWALL